MTVPAHGIDLQSADTIWSVRQTMPKPLFPHTSDSHSFSSPSVLNLFVHAFDPISGARIQLNDVTLTFNDAGKISHYHQEILFAKPTIKVSCVI